MPQQLSRSVQIFGAEGSVGDAIARSWRVLEVLGVPHPAIVVSELLGVHQDLVLGLGRSLRATGRSPFVIGI